MRRAENDNDLFASAIALKIKGGVEGQEVRQPHNLQAGLEPREVLLLQGRYTQEVDTVQIWLGVNVQRLLHGTRAEA